MSGHLLSVLDLEKEKEVLFSFFDLPAEHRSHLRTTNPIESTFATVRLRTQQTKGCVSRIRDVNDGLIAKVVTGVRFVETASYSRSTWRNSN
jgi:hypothetical protein